MPDFCLFFHAKVAKLHLQVELHTKAIQRFHGAWKLVTKTKRFRINGRSFFWAGNFIPFIFCRRAKKKRKKETYYVENRPTFDSPFCSRDRFLPRNRLQFIHNWSEKKLIRERGARDSFDFLTCSIPEWILFVEPKRSPEDQITTLSADAICHVCFPN